MNVSRLKLEAETNYEPRSHYLGNSDPLKTKEKKNNKKIRKKGEKRGKCLIKVSNQNERIRGEQ